MASHPNRTEHHHRVFWRHPLTWIIAAALVFLTLSGFAVSYLPGGSLNQMNVLIHTVVGLLVTVPIVAYLIKHWADYRGYALNHFKLTGYVGGVILLLCLYTGVALTWEGLFSTRIRYGDRTLHLVTTWALLAFMVPHVVLLIVRDRRTSRQPVRVGLNRYLAGTVIGTAVVGALLLVAWFVRPTVALQKEFPEDYSYVYAQGDEKRPFAPSMANTEDGGPIDQRMLGGSRRCGSSGCHQGIFQEWAVSAHRWSAMDVGFQSIQSTMAAQNGYESTRYCGGCHDPISLFSGTKNTDPEHLTDEIGYDQGISCLTCHGIRKTDLQGNANYVISPPPRYLFELNEGRTAKLLSNFLIRTYPESHVNSLSKRLFKKPEYCAACHKQFVDEELNSVGRVQLQNQYDMWDKSKWHDPEGDPSKTIECRECHMPLVADSKDPASGDDLDYNRSPHDGKHRSHRFLASNQLMPLLLREKLAADVGGEAVDHQLELTRHWLRGEIPVPEIADKWAEGPAVPIKLLVPAEVHPGEEFLARVAITANKVGHDFPTGPLDIIQSWVEIRATDQDGNVLFTSGEIDQNNFIQPGSFLFKAEPVDQYGNLIDRHNLWEMTGVRYRRSLMPGFQDMAEFRLLCPSSVGEGSGKQFQHYQELPVSLPENAVGKITVEARLRYRKIDQFLLNFLYGEGAAHATNLTSPITDLSEDSAEVLVVRSTPGT
jgi:hypothetical protein